MSIPVTKILTPYNYNNGQIDRIKYIVIHYVGGTGDAAANCKYYASQYVGASAHYYVGFNGSVYQSVEDKNVAWHCGTKSGYKHPDCRNSNSIGIELCVNLKPNFPNTADSKGWYFKDATVKTAIELTKELMAKYGVTPDRVIRHYDVTGKICPNPYVYDNTEHKWADFKKAITETFKPGWQLGSDGVRFWYQKADGTYPANQWCVINHHWYLFDEQGYMLTGLQYWDSTTQKRGSGRLYYLNDTRNGNLEGACYHEVAEKDGGLEIWYVDGPDTV